MREALVTILAATASALAIILAARFTGKSTEKVAEVTSEVDERRAAAEEWRNLVGALREEVNALRRDQVDDRARIGSLEDARAEDRRRIGELEQIVTDAKRKYRAAVVYIRALLILLRRDAPAAPVPAPPPDLLIDLDS